MQAGRDADVIVLGAGAGGLAAAAHLALAGEKVLVVEAGAEVGGTMASFSRDGCEFDLGLEITMTEATRAMLRPLGLDPALTPYDPARLFTMAGPDTHLAVPQGVAAFRAALHEAFPGERHATDTFLATAQLIAGELAGIPERPHLRDLPAAPWRFRALLRHGGTTVGAYLDSLHASSALRTALLGWAIGSLAVAPSRLSLPAAAAMMTGYLEGSSYPSGGGAAITSGLQEVVRSHGGEIVCGTEAVRVLVSGGEVRGVRVGDASPDAAPGGTDDLLAPAVVSAVDVRETYLRLLPADVVPPRLLRRVRGYEFPMPLASLFLVLDRDLAAEGTPNSIVVASGGEDIEEQYAALAAGDVLPGNAVNLWATSLADPGNPRLCPPGRTNVQLVSVAPSQHDWWGVVPGEGPTERYRARKRQLRDQMVALADRAVPGLADSIVVEEMATPVTSERVSRWPGGASYGPAFTPRQTWTRLGPRSVVSGLFHAGAGYRPSHGLLGVLASGVAAASAITGIPRDELLARPSAVRAVAS